MPIYKKFNFENWFFTDHDKSCLGDFAINLKQLEHNHPTAIAQEKFADTVVIPLLTS